MLQLTIKKLSDISNIEYIEQFERKPMVAQRKKFVKKKLTSDKTFDSFSLLSELDAYSSLVRDVGSENVKYQ